MGGGGTKTASRPGLGPVLLCCGGCMGAPSPGRGKCAAFGENGIKNAPPLTFGVFYGGIGVQKGREEGSDPPFGESQPGSGVAGRIWGGTDTFGTPRPEDSLGRGGAGDAAGSAIPIPRMTPSFCQFLPAFPPPSPRLVPVVGPLFPAGLGGPGLSPTSRGCREGAASHPSPGRERDFPFLLFENNDDNNTNNINNTARAGALAALQQ